MRGTGSVVVMTPGLHDRVLGSRPGPGLGMFGVKSLAVNIGDCVSFVTRMITLMWIPSC